MCVFVNTKMCTFKLACRVKAVIYDRLGGAGDDGEQALTQIMLRKGNKSAD